MRHINTLIILITIPLALLSQQEIRLSGHELITEKYSWLNTGNAAGLGRYNIQSHGISQLSYSSESGSYHRAQEGNSLSGINFYTERYDKLGKHLNVWGSFHFTMDREKERAWSDVISTYENSPYIFGSSVPGSYDRQMFDFKVKAATNKGMIRYGLGIDYKVGDLSRLRDPRTRVFLADYAAIPSVTIQLAPEHTLGLGASVRYIKEKMPNITTVQTDPNLAYYTFYGMENAEAITGGFKSFERQFESYLYGGQIQYELTLNNNSLLIDAGIVSHNQEIIEENKKTPGTYKDLNYYANLFYTHSTTNFLWKATVKSEMTLGAANENLQELQSFNDTITGVNSKNWVTIFTYKNRYISNDYKLQASVKVHRTENATTDYKWNAGVEAGIHSFLIRYNLPFSEMTVNRINIGMSGNYRLLNTQHNSIHLGASIKYLFSISNKLTLNALANTAPATGASTFETGTYNVAQNVVIPDFEYYSKQATQAGIECVYDRTLNLKKSKMTGYLKVGYNYTSSAADTNRRGYSVTIGIIPM